VADLIRKRLMLEKFELSALIATILLFVYLGEETIFPIR